MLSDVNSAKSLTSVKISLLNIAKSHLRTEVFSDISPCHMQAVSHGTKSQGYPYAIALRAVQF